jgi:peptidoglycan hydrolase-like protein with peptidoglycan-binding domain
MKLQEIVDKNESIGYDNLKGDAELTREVQTQLLASGIALNGGTDGKYGPSTRDALSSFVAARGLTRGVVDAGVAQALLDVAAPAIRRLTESDFVDCAGALGCAVAAIRAVVEVESSGSGFLADGRPKILFEAHLFSRFTGHKYDKSNPNISSPTWNRALYSRTGGGEWARLEQAMGLDRTAALKSASWGLFQILGSNFQAAGFNSVDDFVAAMKASEGEQLKAFANFVVHEKLDGFLRKLQWADFAARYNGPSYKKNRYDQKLADSYKRFAAAV